MLYLIDLPYGRNGVNLAIEGAKNGDSTIVLIQDGVYTSGLDEIKAAGVNIVAIKNDVKDRGLSLPNHIKLVDHGELVDMMLEDKVANFV